MSDTNNERYSPELLKDLQSSIGKHHEACFANFLEQLAKMEDDRIRNLQIKNEADANNQLFRDGKL